MVNWSVIASFVVTACFVPRVEMKGSDIGVNCVNCLFRAQSGNEGVRYHIFESNITDPYLVVNRPTHHHFHSAFFLFFFKKAMMVWYMMNRPSSGNQGV